MTKSQSIQTAYNWAYHVRADKKSGLMELLCATEVLAAMEDSQDSYEVAYDALLIILREWQGKRKESLEGPIRRLSRALGMTKEESVSQS